MKPRFRGVASQTATDISNGRAGRLDEKYNLIPATKTDDYKRRAKILGFR